MRVFAFQLNIAWEDKPANFERVRRMVAQANPQPGSLLVLPEMFATGFSMNAEKIAEDYAGPTEQFLAGLAAERKCWLAGGAAVRSKDGRIRNKCLVLSPSGMLAAWYAKRRPFTPGGEREHYAAGEKTCVFEMDGCRTSALVCYDLRFPELFRECALSSRPQLYLVIASWPSKRIAHWIRLLQARAIENQAYLVGVNRTGNDPFYQYCGRSIIVDPQGEIIADAGEAEGVIPAELDLASLQKYRQGLPFLDDMRP